MQSGCVLSVGYTARFRLGYPTMFIYVILKLMPKFITSLLYEVILFFLYATLLYFIPGVHLRTSIIFIVTYLLWRLILFIRETRMQLLLN